ncbi:MAG TPA: CHAP domain-containing protein, partial [Myxococcales bacterium]|nr:CHAP domain-containing protein [Myxococcales bacterium]
LPLAAYEAAGANLFSAAERGDNGVTAIYRYAQREGRIYRGGWPVPGDLVFFRDTYDLNRDGQVNDGLTHVGLVDSVSSDATVTIIHRVRRGVVRYRMNLNHPDWRTDPETGEPINDYLRGGAGATPPRALLTGQLFAAYATVLDGSEREAVARR